MRDNICTYCGQVGHRASQCPRRRVDGAFEILCGLLLAVFVLLVASW